MCHTLLCILLRHEFITLNFEPFHSESMPKSRVISLVVVIVLAVGWYFYSAHRKQVKYNTFYGYFDDARGLQAANEVLVKGVKVGYVKSIKITKNQQVKVVLLIREKIPVRAGSLAMITNNPLTSEGTIELTEGKGAPLPDKTILHTSLDKTFVESFNGKVSPFLHTGKVLLNVLDSTMKSFNYFISAGFGRRTHKDIEEALRNSATLARTAGKYSDEVAEAQPKVDRFEKLFVNPEVSSKKLNQTLAGAEKKTKEFTQKDLVKSLSEINQNIASISKTIRDAGNHKMISEKSTYREVANNLDTLNQSLKAYKKDPPPIQLIGGGGE